MKKLVALVLAFSLLLAIPSGYAASLSLNGTVVNVGEETILSARGGTVENVLVQVGQKVEAGAALATLKTNKVFAQTDGVVRLFGEVGDTAEMVTAQYGTVAYIEPLTPYTVQASTKTADAAEDNKFVHRRGDGVSPRCRKHEPYRHRDGDKRVGRQLHGAAVIRII